MPAPRTVPSQGPKDVVTFTISIDGEAIPLTVEVSALTVFKGIGKIPFARIEILDGDPAAQTFSQSENELFAPGGEIEIQAGYSSQEDLIFRGIIVGQKVRMRKSGRGLLTLLCRHALYHSTLTEKSATFLDSSDSDAISTALGSYDVDLTAESTDIIHEKLVKFPPLPSRNLYARRTRRLLLGPPSHRTPRLPHGTSSMHRHPCPDSRYSARSGRSRSPVQWHSSNLCGSTWNS